MKTLITLLTAFLGMTFSICVNAQTTCTWNGTVSSDWNQPLNWSLGLIPISGSHVVIDSGAYNPVLSQNFTVGNLTINNNTTLTADGINLTVKGNWTNNGNFVAGYGQVIFNGTGHQTISGNQTFYIMEINNESGTEIVSGSDTITGVLKVTYGAFQTNDSLVLYSDANGTGSIGPLTTGSLYGQITMQRFMNVMWDDWRFLSSPVSNFTFDQLNDNIWTSGYTGSTFPGESFISVYMYDETVSGTADNGYTFPQNSTDTLAAGQGFMAYVGTGSISSTLDFTGVPNQGSIDIAVNYTLTDTFSDGWNLVGNPYPSAISWKDAGNTKVNLDNAVYTWNSEQGVYSSYVDGIGANGGSDIIAAGQAFYVRANAANPQLILSESSKRAQPDTYMKSEETVLYLTMKVENSYGYDETVFRPNLNATSGFDSWADAEKMFSYNWMMPSVYSTDADEYYYSINQFELGELEIPVYVNTGISEVHEITFTGIEAFAEAGCVFLEDLHTGIVYDLRTTNSLSLFIADTTYSPRFILRTGAPYFVHSTDANCYGAHNGGIQVAKQSDIPFTVDWFNIYGTQLGQETGIYQITSLENLAAGTYIVESTDSVCGLRSDSLVISQPNLITADFTVDADTVYAPENSVVGFENLSENASYFFWEFGTAGSSDLANPTFEFTQEGSQTVTLYAYQNETCFKIQEKEIVVISALGLDQEPETTPKLFIQNGQLIVNAPNADQIEIYDLNGRLLLSQNAEGQITIIQADLAHNQYYLVQVISGSYTYAKKLYFNN